MLSFVRCFLFFFLLFCSSLLRFIFMRCAIRRRCRLNHSRVYNWLKTGDTISPTSTARFRRNMISILCGVYGGERAIALALAHTPRLCSVCLQCFFNSSTTYAHRTLVHLFIYCSQRVVGWSARSTTPFQMCREWMNTTRTVLLYSISLSACILSIGGSFAMSIFWRKLAPPESISSSTTTTSSLEHYLFIYSVFVYLSCTNINLHWLSSTCIIAPSELWAGSS